MTKKNNKKNSKPIRIQAINPLENFPGVFYGQEDRRPDKIIKMDDDIKKDLISK
jgi:hypothetical protein